jgi:hypothetical protein
MLQYITQYRYQYNILQILYNPAMLVKVNNIDIDKKKSKSKQA